MRAATLWIGPLLACLAALAVVRAGASAEAAWTAGVIALCAVWWVAEPIPIPATSLVPLAVLPAVGVLSAAEVGAAYGNKLILLLLGGFMLSKAMERSGAHRRVALQMVRLCAVGGDPSTVGGRRLVFGFMLATAALSMWVSNSATTLMMLPIALATLDGRGDHRLRRALLLGIAYAASIGGVGTPVGTPPNLIFLQVYGERFGDEPSFTTWMAWALPVVVVMLPVAAWWLTRSLPAGGGATRLPEVGAWRPAEARTLAVFAVTAVLWVTLKEPAGGWTGWLGLPGASTASVALGAVVAMFLIPSGERDAEGRVDRLLDWETAVRIPWGVLLLFSSGLVLAKAFGASGLDDLVRDALGVLGDLPTPLVLAAVCLSVTFLTEVTSNTATTSLLMPLLATTAVAIDADPRLLMVPAAISASFAFMLPVATAPNAAVFSSGEVTVGEMAREGLGLNLVGAAVVAAACYAWFG